MITIKVTPRPTTDIEIQARELLRTGGTVPNGPVLDQVISIAYREGTEHNFVSSTNGQIITTDMAYRLRYLRGLDL
jgi:hypothetical protein